MQGQEEGSAALGASASVLVNNLLGSVDGLSAQEKEARKNLVTGLVAGIAAASGTDAALAQNAAQIEVKNNQLALPPQALPPMWGPLVSPREAQQGVEPITTPMNEEVSEYGNAIFSEDTSGRDNRKKNPPKAESPVWNRFQNAGYGIKTDGRLYY